MNKTEQEAVRDFIQQHEGQIQHLQSDVVELKRKLTAKHRSLKISSWLTVTVISMQMVLIGFLAITLLSR